MSKSAILEKPFKTNFKSEILQAFENKFILFDSLKNKLSMSKSTHQKVNFQAFQKICPNDDQIQELEKNHALENQISTQKVHSKF